MATDAPTLPLSATAHRLRPVQNMRRTPMRYTASVVVVLLLAACSNKAAIIDNAEGLVRQSARLSETVKSDRDAEFRNVSIVPGSDMVCGEVRWRNLMGGMGDYWPFHVVDNQPEFAPSPPFVPTPGYTTNFARQHARCPKNSSN